MDKLVRRSRFRLVRSARLPLPLLALAPITPASGEIGCSSTLLCVLPVLALNVAFPATPLLALLLPVRALPRAALAPFGFDHRQRLSIGHGSDRGRSDLHS